MTRIYIRVIPGQGPTIIRLWNTRTTFHNPADRTVATMTRDRPLVMLLVERHLDGRRATE